MFAAFFFVFRFENGPQSPLYARMIKGSGKEQPRFRLVLGQRGTQSAGSSRPARCDATQCSPGRKRTLTPALFLLSPLQAHRSSTGTHGPHEVTPGTSAVFLCYYLFTAWEHEGSRGHAPAAGNRRPARRPLRRCRPPALGEPPGSGPDSVAPSPELLPVHACRVLPMRTTQTNKSACGVRDLGGL